MDSSELLSALFPSGHAVRQEGDFLAGEAGVAGNTIAVFGTANHAAIGIELAFALADFILQVVREHPGRPILLLVDTQGQRLRHRDELLGINAYMAHLAKCIELARRTGHRVVSLVYGRAVSGGYITGGMMADACFALTDAEISVMNLPAMARVTKIPQEKLEELAKNSPVFAPGAKNYFKMGALDSLWSGNLAEALAAALRDGSTQDRRRELGAERGGRNLALGVAERVKGDAPQ
jgi:malonate decarboxylase gamma subunit